MYPQTKADLNTRALPGYLNPPPIPLPLDVKDLVEKFSTMFREALTSSERSAILSTLRASAEELRSYDIEELKRRLDGAKREIEAMEKDAAVKIQDLSNLIF